MQKGISFVGLMDLGTLDALKKSSVAKIPQVTAEIHETEAELTLKKEEKEETFRSAPLSNGQAITHPQQC
jgi:hypothetical protein